MKVIFIVPCYNASKNIHDLSKSLISQKDDRWMCIFIDDMSTDNTCEEITGICEKNRRFSLIRNTEKKYALRNIVEQSRMFQERSDVVIAVVDGDDSLCNDNTVSHLISAYDSGSSVVWTAHKWDINGMNISRELPKNIDPYAWPWCSSHLRTFKPSLLKKISDKNFKNCTGEWFKRGYDQALMLPVLKVSDRNTYLPEVCYLYNINSVSISDRSWEERDQISTINIVRARGFLK